MRVFLVLLLLFFGMAFASHGVAQQIPQVPRGIMILRSNKADLSKIAKVKNENGRSPEYDYDGMKIKAEIAVEPCLWHGWNVRPGTIVGLTIYPGSPQKIDTSELLSEGFDLVTDDTFREYYTNRGSGIQYYVEHDNSSYKNLINVRYYPTAADSKMRCVGFPPFNATSEIYSLGDSPFRIADFNTWDMGLLGDIGFRVKDSKSLKGFIVIYFSETDFKKAVSFQKKLIKFARSMLRVPSNRFQIQLGGLRDENMIETYLLSVEQPDPTPRPKYQSPMVFGLR